MILLIAVFIAVNISNAQNIGIHTTTPIHPLQVNVDLVSFDTLTDQQNASTNSILNINPGQTAGQSITLGMDGELAKISFILHNASGTMTLSVHEGSLPGGALLAEQNIIVNNTVPTEYEVILPSPMIQVQAGDELFIALTNLSVDIAQWRKSNANPYPAGLAYLHSDAWYPIPNDDLSFTTFMMQTDTTDTPILMVRQDGHIGINNYALPLQDGSTGQLMITDGNGSLTWTDATQISVDKIMDADGDTQITTEKNPDEDIIRFDLGGTERVVMKTNPNNILSIALYDTTRNTLIGQETGQFIETIPDTDVGMDNTMVGYQAGFSNTIGYANTAIGSEAFKSNTTGRHNIAVGDKSLYMNTSGDNNNAIGRGALFSNTTGDYNTGIGDYALGENTTGEMNIAIGSIALANNTTGSGNIAIGNATMVWNQGSENTATGHWALNDNTSGYNNSALGAFAMSSNTSGYNNTSLGHSSLRYNTSGTGNAALGANALEENTIGNYNTALGESSLPNSTTGYNNTAVGHLALQNNTTGVQRTALGSSSNSTGVAYNNSTGIGYNADCTATNQVRIGNSSVNSIGGFANWTNLSDGRFKNQISENVPGLDFIQRLRPVTYHLDIRAIDNFFAEKYNERDSFMTNEMTEKESMLMTGFIAQEVEAVAVEIGYDFSGVDAPKNENDFYGLRYAEFVVPLVKAVQEQQTIIENLQNTNSQLMTRLLEQEAKLHKLIGDISGILDGRSPTITNENN